MAWGRILCVRVKINVRLKLFVFGSCFRTLAVIRFQFVCFFLNLFVQVCFSFITLSVNCDASVAYQWSLSVQQLENSLH